LVSMFLSIADRIAQRETCRKRAQTPNQWFLFELLAEIEHPVDRLFRGHILLFHSFFDLADGLRQRFTITLHLPLQFTLVWPARLAWLCGLCVAPRSVLSHVRSSWSCARLCIENLLVRSNEPEARYLCLTGQTLFQHRHQVNNLSRFPWLSFHFHYVLSLSIF